MPEKIEVTFLGTASATPSSKRNHSAILFSYRSENILIDCGEGTQRQFKVAGLNPCKLTKILITHWHGDHTLGLPGLLETLSTSEYSKKLQIYGPKKTKEKFSLLEKIYGRFRIDHEIKEISTKKIYENDALQINSALMDHRPPSIAYSLIIKDRLRIKKPELKKLKIKNSSKLKKLLEKKDITLNGKKLKWKKLTYLEKGKKITIILDTKINQRAISLAKNSDILICESTFSESEKEKASQFKHLTAKDAATIAKKSGSKKLVLTHLSQRYSNKTSKILQEAKKIFKNTSIAEDLNQLTL